MTAGNLIQSASSQAIPTPIVQAVLPAARNRRPACSSMRFLKLQGEGIHAIFGPMKPHEKSTFLICLIALFCAGKGAVAGQSLERGHIVHPLYDGSQMENSTRVKPKISRITVEEIYRHPSTSGLQFFGREYSRFERQSNLNTSDRSRYNNRGNYQIGSQHNFGRAVIY